MRHPPKYTSSYPVLLRPPQLELNTRLDLKFAVAACAVIRIRLHRGSGARERVGASRSASSSTSSGRDTVARCFFTTQKKNNILRIRHVPRNGGTEVRQFIALTCGGGIFLIIRARQRPMVVACGTRTKIRVCITLEGKREGKKRGLAAGRRIIS